MKFLVVVDDHPVGSEGLLALLGRAFSRSTVVVARDASDVSAALDRHPDLDAVIVDLNEAGPAGTPVISDIGRRRSDLPIVVLSSSEDPRDVRRSIALGALGYVPKSAAHTTLSAAIRLVLEGNVYVPPIRRSDREPSPSIGSSPSDLRLTPRQLEILALLSRGMSNQDIAQTLKIAPKTVKVHITIIFKLLHVANRTQAAAAGRSTGLI